MPVIELDKDNWKLAAKVILESFAPDPEWALVVSEEQDTLHFDLDVRKGGKKQRHRITFRWWDTMQEQVNRSPRCEVEEVSQLEETVLAIRVKGDEFEGWDLWGCGFIFANMRWSLEGILHRLVGHHY